jgi:hypothetical protein
MIYDCIGERVTIRGGRFRGERSTGDSSAGENS